MNPLMFRRKVRALLALIYVSIFVFTPLSLGESEVVADGPGIVSTISPAEETAAPVAVTPSAWPEATATQSEPPTETEIPQAFPMELPTVTLLEAPMETSPDTPLETPTAESTETPAETPVETFTDTPTETLSEPMTEAPDETPAASESVETAITPFPQETAPACDIPNCPHVTVNENGDTVALCPLGAWMLVYEQNTPLPAPSETPLRFSSLAQTLTLEATSTLMGGDIQFSDFQSVVLNGKKQTTTATWAFADIVDTSGLDEGWNLSLTLTPMQEWSGTAYVENGAVWGESSLKVDTMPVLTPMDGSGQSTVQVSTVEPSTALDTNTPVKLLINRGSTGVSSFSVSNMTVSLDIPANAYAGTYKTDATIALTLGP